MIRKGHKIMTPNQAAKRFLLEYGTTPYYYGEVEQAGTYFFEEFTERELAEFHKALDKQVLRLEKFLAI